MIGNLVHPSPHTPFIDPAVHSTSIYSSYLARRPKEERKVKTDVKLSWLLWLKKNLGEGKPAVVSISRAGRHGTGGCLGFQNGCIQQQTFKKNKWKGIKKRGKERIF